VDDALTSGAAAREAGLATELEQKAAEVRESFGEYAISPDGGIKSEFQNTPLGGKYAELRSSAAGATGHEEMKATVFNHLYTFFSRYYEGGDFLSRRRYSRRQKYAIPYNGEEVYLHWANADQYYVKTGQDFTDYHYKAPNGVAVHFKLVAASVEQNNNKGDHKYFVPRTGEATYDPTVRALAVPFEHRPLTGKEEGAYGTKKERQKGINDEAVSGLMERFKSEPEALAAMTDVKGRDSEDRLVGYLEHHLRRYVRGNTQDFFVHKDLGGFLEGELDFYLKNEVLNIDDLDLSNEARAEGWFEVMRAMKRIGRGIIAFLAQIEDYQKRLFEKKKFVARADYCLTLDNVPEDLYPEILANDAQFAEWERLFEISAIEGTVLNGGGELNEQWLRDNPYLVLDTKLFGEDFKDRLLGSIEDLDERTDGLLIESENFQALNLLQDRYHEQVKCIYIDPPYNTGDDGFIYKDNYQHSSWLSMINDRLLEARVFNDELGTIAVSIDDVENGRLIDSLDRAYGPGNQLATLVWDRNRKNDAKFFSVGHEYMMVYAKNRGLLEDKGIRFREPKEGLEDAKVEFERLKKKYGDDWEKIREGWMDFFERIPVSDPRRRLMRYTKVGPRGPYRDDGNINWPGGGGPRYEIIHPETEKPVKIPTSGWRYKNPARFWEVYKDGKIVFGTDEATIPSTVSYLFDSSNQVMPSVFYSYAQTAAQEFNNLFREGRVFDNPKNWRDISRLANYLADDRDTILDFFAGSGTTGHSVINLNREDGGNRKYILVEMGEYFDTVLKPRIQKVIYSKDWRDGRPVSREGTSHIFKYLSLEQYEDTLNNISFTNEAAGQNALELYGDDYLLRYMLDFETRGSETLLNVEAMSAPFDYKLTLHEDGQTRAMPVDLPETFAYLLGLRVKSRKVYYDGERRYLVYRGATPEPERREVAAIWRDTQGWEAEDLDRDREFVQQEGLAAETDEVFVNGDSFIPEARPLEPVFKQRMLAEPASG
jgi:adenine-specific DNA-methyltransferase